MDNVTKILDQIEQGEASAAEQLLPLIYDELRKLAKQRLSSALPLTIYEAVPWSSDVAACRIEKCLGIS